MSLESRNQSEAASKGSTFHSQFSGKSKYFKGNRQNRLHFDSTVCFGGLQKGPRAHWDLKAAGKMSVQRPTFHFHYLSIMSPFSIYSFQTLHRIETH